MTRNIGYRDVVERKRLLSAPRLYGERVPVKLLRTSNSKVRQKIVDTHNYLRTQVKPPAANMLAMVSDLSVFTPLKFRSSLIDLRSPMNVSPIIIIVIIYIMCIISIKEKCH